MPRLAAWLLLALLPVAAAAQPVAPGDFLNLSVGPSGLPLNGTASLTAVAPDGTVFAAGFFAVPGQSAANRVARWDGSAWQVLGTIAGNPRAMTVADGSLYIGGSFSSVDGVPASNVARWNGSAWEAMGAGVGFEVLCFTRGPDGTLYAGGFTPGGSAGGPRMALWDGTQWIPFATWPDGNVRGMAFGADGKLYIGGDFTQANGVGMDRVGRWSGTAWESLGSSVSGNVLTMAATTDGTVYVGGQLSAIDGAPISGLARWTGSGWASVDGGIVGSVIMLTAAPDGRLLAGGSFNQVGGQPARNVAWWDGSAWTRPAVSITSQVNAVIGAPDGSVVIGGGFTSIDGAAIPYVARWTGSSWQPFGSAFTGQVRTAVRALDGSIIVGGDFLATGSAAASGVARWDGTAWSSFGALSQPRSLSVASDGTLYAASGQFSGLADIRRWDPSTSQWVLVTGGVSSSGSVSAVAARSSGGVNTVYVGGSFFVFAGPTFFQYLAQTTGSGWSPLGSGVNGTVLALAVAPDGGLYAGGEFSTAGGAGASRVARWDPETSTWSALGSGVDGSVRAMMFAPDGSLYVGGDFQNAGGAPASRVARWDPETSTWSALGSGVDGTVRALAVAPDGLVYAGGDFATAGGAPATRLARWDPAAGSWGAPATGPDATVNALAVTTDGDVVLGGTFFNAGSVTSPYVALYDAPTTGALGFEQPTAGAAYRVGGWLKAIWTSPLPAPPTVVLSIRKGEGPWLDLYTGPNLTRPDFGTARWLIPSGVTLDTDYQLRIADASDLSSFSLSERFAIVDPRSRFEVTAPRGAALGGSLAVTWTAPPFLPPGPVTVAVVPTAGGPAISEETTDNDGAHVLAIPSGAAPGSYRAVVSTVAPAGYTGESAPVRVGAAAVPSPASGATATAGAPLSVTYEAPTATGPLTAIVTLRQPGVAGGTRLARVDGQPSSGTLDVTLPADLADGAYYVVVRLTAGSTSVAAPSGVFTVSGGAPRAVAPAPLAHFARPAAVPAGVFATREAALTVRTPGLPDGAEVGVFAPAGRRGTLTLVGAGHVAGGRAEISVAGAVVVGDLPADGRAAPTDYVLVPDGAPLTLRVFDGATEQTLDTGQPLAFADGAEWTVGAAATAAGVADALTVAAWPNPVAGTATVHVSLPADVAVFDVLGRRVADLSSGATDGVRTLAWDTRGVAPGVYVIRAASATATAATRVTVVR